MLPAAERYWREVAQSIRANLDAINKQLEAINKNTKPDDAAKEEQPTEITVSELKLPMAVSEYYKAENENRPRKRLRRFRILLEIIGVAAAFALALLTYSTLNEVRKQTPALIKAANAAKSAADTAQWTLANSRQTVLSELRPYVAMTDSLLDKPLAPGSQPQVQLRFLNSGRTPAMMIMRAMVIVRKTEISDNDTEPSPLAYPSRSVVGPGGTSVAIFNADRPISSQDLVEIKKGSLKLSAYGVMTYSDLFKETHHLWFCAIYIPSVDRLVNCAKYNRVD